MKINSWLPLLNNRDSKYLNKLWTRSSEMFLGIPKKCILQNFPLCWFCEPDLRLMNAFHTQIFLFSFYTKKYNKP